MKILFAVCVFAVLSLVGYAEPVVSEDSANKAFEDAAMEYKNYIKPEKEPAAVSPELKLEALQEKDITFPNQNVPYHNSGKNADSAGLSEHVFSIDLKNVRLEDAVVHVIKEISAKSGPWEVRWRLKPENQVVLEERVNIIAETNFGSFIDYLSDRVRNMTGISLAVTVFDKGRIILISDTYY